MPFVGWLASMVTAHAALAWDNGWAFWPSALAGAICIVAMVVTIANDSTD